MSYVEPEYDISIVQNQTFEFPFALSNDDGSPIDITNWSFSGSIKEKFSDTTPKLFFTMSVVSNVSGSLMTFLPAAATWTLTGKKYLYDIIGTNYNVTPVETLRILQGKVVVDLGVTKP